ncbi:hypothetical protein F4775DRAFT_551423 [Biscogniauxia sp. FL1348]|nr:hypothetical protein F4775DRAFT_551423 [Biscogniauxia sp. FL1348]
MARAGSRERMLLLLMMMMEGLRLGSNNLSKPGKKYSFRCKCAQPAGQFCRDSRTSLPLADVDPGKENSSSLPFVIWPVAAAAAAAATATVWCS